MRKRIGFGALIVLAGSLLAATSPAKKPRAANPQVARGKYLVEILVCGDCHSPKKMSPQGPVEDETRRLSGATAGPLAPAPPSTTWVAHGNADFTAWAGPWGVSFAKNLTPDENTGIGSWSEETFIKAIRTGKHMGVSRPILPPMPWQHYAMMTDADLKSVYAYLRTIPKIHNPTPDPIPPAGTHP
jgi:hypothetical protein